MTDLQDAKQRILQQVNLPQLIGESVELRDRSGRKTGLCPFHEEKSPSFTVYDDHYFCFGCRQHGDAITFVRKVHGFGFIDALKFLAEKFGVSAPELSQKPEDQAKADHRSRLLKATSIAQTHFAAALSEASQQAVRSYLHERGFDDQSITEIGFGFAPDDFHSLERKLRSLGFKDQELVDASLAARSKRANGIYDFFRGRLTIPIRDAVGRVIAFGARTLNNEGAKYINSRESDIYDKSRVLFGLDRAKDTIRKKDRALVCEGYMDTLQLWQQGFPESVACLGTALTKYQLMSLSGLCQKVFLLFDGDQAGKQASLRSLAIGLEVPKVSLRVVTLPEGDDPDSFVRREGAAKLEELMSSAPLLIDHVITAKLADYSDERILEPLRREILPWISKVEDRLQRSYLLSRVAQISGLSPNDLSAEIKPLVQPQKAFTPQVKPRQVPQKRSIPRKEFTVIGHVFFAEPNDIAGIDLTKWLTEDLELPPEIRQFAHIMLTLLEGGTSPSSAGPEQLNPTANEALEGLVDKLRSMRQAFEITDRKQGLIALRQAEEVEQKRKLVARLREKLYRAPAEHQRELLSMVDEVNKELLSLEKQPLQEQ